MTQDPGRERIRRNVEKMRAQGAPEDDVRRYLEDEDKQDTGFSGSGGGASWGAGTAEEASGRGTFAAEPSRAALQGVSFGFADEATAAARAAADVGPKETLKAMLPGERGAFGKSYDRNVAAERAALSEFRGEHPIGAIASELGGGLITGSALAKAPLLAGRSTAGTIARGVGAGAAGGAVAGAGVAEGGLSERARGAAVGGVLGGAVGGAVPVVAKAGGRLADLIPGLRPKTAAAPATGGVTMHANPIGPLASSAQRRAFDSAEERADQLLLRSLERDKTSPRAIAQQVHGAESVKPETIMDLAGENTRGLARGAQSIPSRARDELAEGLTGRSANQRDRVVKDLVDVAGLKRADVYEKAEDLINARRRNALPLYNRAYKAPPLNDPVVHETLALPGFDKAHAAARRIAEIEGVALPPLTRTVQRVKGNAQGVLEKVSTQEPVPQPLQALDYVKRAIDDAIYSRTESASGLSHTEARALNGRLKELLAHVDEQVPDYKAARRQFAGDSEIKDALEEGKDYFKTDPDALRKRLREMSPSAREAYRLGAASKIGDEMERTADGRDLVKVVFGTERKRQQMHVLLDDEKTYAKFSRAMMRESQMARTKQGVLGGSPTARIQAEQADIDGSSFGALVSGATGGAGGMALNALKASMAARMRGVTTATADALSPRLTAGLGSGGNAELLDALELLEQHSAKLMQRNTRRTGIARTTGSVTGLETGRP